MGTLWGDGAGFVLLSNEDEYTDLRAFLFLMRLSRAHTGSGRHAERLECGSPMCFSVGDDDTSIPVSRRVRSWYGV